MSHRSICLLVLSCALLCSFPLPAEQGNAAKTVHQTIFALEAELKAVGLMLQELQPLPVVEKRAVHAMSLWTLLQSQASGLSGPDLDRAKSKLRTLEEQMASIRRLLNLPDPKSRTLRSADGSDGAISGWVTELGTGSPISGVEINVYDICGWAGYDDTDSAGKYTVTGLPEGTYYVRTNSWDQFVDELYDNIECWEGDCTPQDGTAVTVHAGAITSKINFQLQRSGSISGTVLGVGLLPVPWYHVHVYDDQGNLVQYGDVGDDGLYHAEGLRDGNYYAITHAQDYQNQIYNGLPCADVWTCDPLTGTPIAVSAGSDTPGIDFHLQEFGSIEGKITDSATGEPLPGIWVEIYASRGWYYTSAKTNNRGKYWSEGLPDGSYFVRTQNSLGYKDQLFRDIDCSEGCDVTQGRPVQVHLGQKTRKVHFILKK